MKRGISSGRLKSGGYDYFKVIPKQVTDKLVSCTWKPEKGVSLHGRKKKKKPLSTVDLPVIGPRIKDIPSPFPKMSEKRESARYNQSAIKPYFSY